MKNIRLLFMLLLSGFIWSAASAQEGKLSLNINYGVNFPLGSFKSDVVNKTSLIGWNANLLYGINDRFSVGLQTGYNDYHQKYPRQVYDTKDGSISAVLTNSVKTVPVLAKARYNLTTGGFIQPYVGAGIGGNIVSFDQYLGEFASSKTGFYFAASPEAGVTIPFGRSGAGVTIGANYNYMPFGYGDIKNLNNWGVYGGIKFPFK